MSVGGRLIRALVLTVTAFSTVAHPAAAAQGPEVGETVVKRGTVTSDLYAFGGGVDIAADVNGDVIAGGGRVTVGQRIQGDLMVGAGSVILGGRVDRNVRAAGGAVTITGRVGRNVNAAGGTVTIAPDALVGGNARLAGGELRIAGTIARKLRAAGALVVLAGEVVGDVELVAQEIEILPTARLRGKLTYWSPRDARIDPGAKISGQVTHNLPELPRVLARTGTALVTVSRALFMAGVTVLGIALYLLFPAFTVLASRTIGSDPVKSAGIGLLFFTALPVAAILSMLTILGIPLGLIIFVVYSLALLVGFLLAAFHLGDVGAHALVRKGARKRPVRVAFLIVALLLLLFARRIPFIGGVLIVLAVLLGLGAMTIHTWRHWSRPATAR